MSLLRFTLVQITLTVRQRPSNRPGLPETYSTGSRLERDALLHQVRANNVAEFTSSRVSFGRGRMSLESFPDRRQRRPMRDLALGIRAVSAGWSASTPFR